MGKKKQAIILGAGISGLALGYYLSKNKELEVVVLEKEERPGGWLHTDTSSGFHFETGPRTFKASRSAALLELIDELDMRGEVIYSAKESQKRYLWRDKKLRKAPDFFLLKELFFSLLKEWRVPKGPSDESIWAFAERRFGKKIAQFFFDPFTTGIYAGDSRNLSVRSCFPGIKNGKKSMARSQKGFFQRRKKRRHPAFCPFREAFAVWQRSS